LRPKIQHKELGGKSMIEILTICPHCKESNTVQKSSHADMYGLQRIQCSHCSKAWSENVGETLGLTKSAPSGEFAKLRENLAELGRVVDAYVARNAAATPARFQPQGQEAAPTVLKFVAGMPGGVMLESDLAESAEVSRQQAAFVTKASSEDVSRAALQKSLANGKPVTSPNYAHVGDGLEKDARSTTIVERTAPAGSTRRSFQPLSE
jgi:hypothetical protein